MLLKDAAGSQAFALVVHSKMDDIRITKSGSSAYDMLLIYFKQVLTVQFCSPVESFLSYPYPLPLYLKRYKVILYKKSYEII